jgi:hypothetical protein
MSFNDYTEESKEVKNDNTHSWSTRKERRKEKKMRICMTVDSKVIKKEKKKE